VGTWGTGVWVPGYTSHPELEKDGPPCGERSNATTTADRPALRAGCIGFRAWPILCTCTNVTVVCTTRRGGEGGEEGGGRKREYTQTQRIFLQRRSRSSYPSLAVFSVSNQATVYRQCAPDWRLECEKPMEVDFYAHVLVGPASKLFVRHTAFLMLPSAPCCDEGVEGNSIPRIGR
jgi:hypothetical protein